MPSRKELLKDFYSKYSPETQLTEERLTAIDNKYGDDNKALLTDFYSKYAPEVELTDERFEAISKKYSLASGGGDMGKQQGSTEPSEQSQDTTTTPSSETPLERVEKPINEDTQGSIIIGDKYYSPNGVAAEPEYSQLAVDKSIDRNVKAYDSELKASYNEMAEIRNNINSLKEQVGELDIMKKRLSKTPTPMPSLGASYQGALEGYNQNVEQINQKASELNSAIGALSEQDKAAVKRYNEILKNKTSYDEMKMQESEDVKNLQRAVSKEMIDNLPSTMRLGARFLGGVIMGGKNIAASVMEAFGTGAPTFTEEDIANAPTEEIRNLYSNIREKHLKESKEWFDKANELKLSAEETKTQYGLITDLEELGEDVTPLNIINFAVTSAAEQMPQIPLAIATLGVGTYEQTMGSIMGSVIGEIVKENKAKGMSDEDAFNAALEDERLNRGAAEGAAVGVAALDLLGASKFLGGIGKKSAQKYLQSQLKTSGAKRFATGVFTEEATEIAQEFVEAGGRGALRGDGFVEGVSEVTAEDVANIAAKTFFGVSGFSAVNAYTNDGKIDNENVNMLFKAAKDDKTLKALEEQIALKRINGDITEEQYQERIQQLADDIAVVSTIPNEVSEDNRAKAIELQNKYNEKMLAKSEASDAFKDLYNEDLESIKNELQSLTSKPKQPTETSTTSKTDNAEAQQEITPEQEVKEQQGGEMRVESKPQEPKGEDVKEEIESVAKVSGVKAKNIKGLYDINRKMFSQNRVKSLASAVVMDRAIGQMAKRAGITKDEMYSKVKFKKGDKAPDGSLKQESPIWESTAKKGIGVIQQKAATPEQWVKMITDKGGKGTSQELDWIGLQDYLTEWKRENNSKSVPKEVVEQYIADNQIEVVEVGKTDSSDIKWKEDEYGFVNSQNSVYEIRPEYGKFELYRGNGFIGTFETLNGAKEAATRFENTEAANKVGGTKYSDYTLEGGENYREVLLTLPERRQKEYSDAQVFEAYQNFNPNATLEEALAIAKDRPKEIISKLENGYLQARDTETNKNYKSSHWDESNILAHLRINERTLPNGERVMFIEEVQSDWAQEGKKKGFKNKVKDESLIVERAKDGTFNVTKEGALMESGFKTEKEAQEFTYSDVGLTPDMPYKKTDQWVGMAMRRAMQMAAQEGFDRIAWVTGEQSAERYSLKEKVNSISVQPNESGRFVFIDMKGNYNVTLNVDDSGKITEDENNLSGEQSFTGKQLEDVVGKDMADKILSQTEESKFEGDGLEVGGEGMKAFYNSILPNVAKKEAQRFDKKAKVEVVGIDMTEKNKTRPNDTFVNGVSQENNPWATSILQVGGVDSYTLTNEILDRIKEKVAKDKANGIYSRNELSKNEELVKSLTVGDKISFEKQTVTSDQLSIAITPEMRMNLNSAVPLFQGEQGAMLAEDGNYIIYALTNPNVSTPLHELAHVYEHYLNDTERKQILSWAGKSKWDTGVSERFARGFERYLASGKAPDSRLQKIFDKFKEWLTEIYNGIKGSDIDIELNNEMKSIYDKMLGGNETKLQDGKKEQKIKTATSGVAKAIRAAKFTKTISDLNKLQSDPTGLLKVAWDGALEIVATTIEAGGTVAQAIKNGVDHIKTTEWYNNLSDSGKKSAEKKVATAIKESASEHSKKIKQDKREITKKANRANERLKGGKFFNKTIVVGNFMSALKNLGNITDEDLLLEINDELNAIMRRGVADVNTDRINDLTRRILEKQPEETKLTAKERAKKAMASVRGRNVSDMAQLVSFELAVDKAMNELDNALTVGEITEDEYNKALEQISEAYEDSTEGLSDADSYTALIQNKGNLTRTKNAIDKAFSNGEITEAKKAELEAGLNAASKKFEADKEAVIKENNESAKEFFKNNKSTEVAETFNLSKPQYIVVDKLFDVFKRAEVFVDDLAISDKLAKIADAMEQGYFPLKDINEVYRSILSKGRSKELISVLDSAGKNISKKGSEKISLLLSATVLGFKSGKFGRGIKESAVLEKYVYGPLLEAIGQSEAASKQIIDDFFKSTKMSFIGSLNPVKRKQRKRNIILAGVFMNQLTNQDEKGSSKKVGIMFPKQSGSDGSKLDIGSVDWLGIILGKEAAINAAKGEMNPTTRSALLKGKLKSGYGKADLKTMEEVWESLPKNEDGSVDYDEFFNNSDKYLNEDTRTLIEASQKAFADGYEYISAAKMIRGERLDEIVSYYKRARQGAGDAQIDYNTINSTPNLRVVAGSSINRTSNDVGAIDFNVLNTVTANAIESPKMFNFEINGGLVNSTLGRTSVGTDEKDLVAGMKDDARASVNFNFSRSNAGTLLMNKALVAQYFRVLLEPIRIGIEIFSLTNRALTQVGLKNTALGVLPKVLPIETRSKVVENLENLTGIKLTADTTAQMEQGSPSELSKESRSSIDIRKTRGLPTALRYFMAVPEHIFDVAFAYPTFEKAFRSVTGEDFDANKFKDKDYRADNRQAIVDAMTLAQSEMTTIMSVGAKFSARRNIKIAPITTKRWAYIGADTSAGGVLNYMSTFVFKEGSTVEEAMRFTYDMFRKNGYKLSNSGELTGETFKSDIYRKAAGVVLAGVTYSYMRQLQFLLEKANDDDDDERREAEKLLKSEYGMVYRNGRVKSFKPQDALAGMVTTVADQIGFMFIGTYGQALRLAVIASLSMAYNLLDKSQEKERKMIENILRKRFYTAPVGDSKYAKGQFFAKAIPLMDIGAAEYHAVSGVSKDMVDIGKDLANKKGGLSEDKAAKYRLGLSTLRLFNMALLLNSGVQVPNTRKMERWMEGEIKKKSK